MNKISTFSDEKLLRICAKYGSLALLWRRKFIGLLPEVNRRALYEKKGFHSIFEFAAKMGGISEEQVRLVLNLHRKFQDKPALKSVLESGKVSVNKLARVASVVKPENEEFWAHQVRLLSKNSLDTLVRDAKTVAENKDQNGFSEPNFAHKSLPGHTKVQSNHNNVKSENSHGTKNEPLFSYEVKARLLELQDKGIDINEMILEFLEKRDLEIAREKEQLAAREQQKFQNKQIIWNTPDVTMPRYISKKIRNILKREYGEKCSIQACRKLAEEIHHTNRFALGKIHDPRYLAPLCKEHHQIAHSIDRRYHETRARIF